MIQVSIKRLHTKICEISICNHAGYADKGQDLVCAGVSSIAVGMMNAVDQLVPDTCDFVLQDAYIKMNRKCSNEDAQILLEAMVYQLQTLKENYQTYIRIDEQEV